ncbi:MAG: hypothetical protein KAS98_04625 [Deltaproteobacteria bacterium]|nr:hypothetical protein [Deltaproteobacteria bacterium]
MHTFFVDILTVTTHNKYRKTMATDLKPGHMRTHANVTKTRVTVLGFNFTIVIFLSGFIVGNSGHPIELAIWYHLNEFVALFSGLIIGFFALYLYLFSQDIDLEGASGIWSFTFAEVLMYIALAQTLSGAAQYFTVMLSNAIDNFPSLVSKETFSKLEFDYAANFLKQLIFWISSIAWLFFVYFAPICAVCSNPLSWKRKIPIFLFYLSTLLIVFLIAAQVHYLKSLNQTQTIDIFNLFINQFFQPKLWGLYYG